MGGIGLQPGEAAIFDDRDCAASRDAEPAVSVNALHAGGIGHGSNPLWQLRSWLMPIVAIVQFCLKVAYTIRVFEGAAKAKLTLRPPGRPGGSCAIAPADEPPMAMKTPTLSIGCGWIRR